MNVLVMEDLAVTLLFMGFTVSGKRLLASESLVSSKSKN